MVPAERCDDDVDDADDTAQSQRRAGLVPFHKGDPRASAAGRKGAEAKRAQRTARARTIAQVVKALDQLGDSYVRSRLGPDSVAAAGWVIGQVVTGHVPIRNADEAATLLRALVDVARLEAGEATSTSVIAHLGTSATADVIALRDQARAALGHGSVIDVDSATSSSLSSTATAAEDTPGHSGQGRLI